MIRGEQNNSYNKIVSVQVASLSDEEKVKKWEMPKE